MDALNKFFLISNMCNRCINVLRDINNLKTAKDRRNTLLMISGYIDKINEDTKELKSLILSTGDNVRYLNMARFLKRKVKAEYAIAKENNGKCR